MGLRSLRRGFESLRARFSPCKNWLNQPELSVRVLYPDDLGRFRWVQTSCGIMNQVAGGEWLGRFVFSSLLGFSLLLWVLLQLSGCCLEGNPGLFSKSCRSVVFSLPTTLVRS